ncbi:hypothetical protein VNO77_15547 [Canavalia gladiata]|uniref:Uncharacterized protein n=1 Tax=Canavalia gladiata TaxID=3824 RepID=A0AAN9M437_CANGL
MDYFANFKGRGKLLEIAKEGPSSYTPPVRAWPDLRNSDSRELVCDTPVLSSIGPFLLDPSLFGVLQVSEREDQPQRHWFCHLRPVRSLGTPLRLVHGCHNVHLPLDSMGSRCSAWTMAVTQARPCGGFSLHDSSTETLTPQQLCVYSLRYYWSASPLWIYAITHGQIDFPKRRFIMV